MLLVRVFVIALLLQMSSASSTSSTSGITVQADKVTLGRYSRDWHNLSSILPSGVVVARTVDDVVAAVTYAKKHRLKAVVRVSGHSSDSSLCHNGLVIDVRNLNAAKLLNTAGTPHLRIGAGASWHDAITALSEAGCSTSAQTDWQGLSIGGVLSVGGMGPALFRNGPLLKQVQRIRVVTGNAETMWLKRGDQLFGAVLGGQGQFGVIVEVDLGNLQCPKWSRARVYHVVSTLEASVAGYAVAEEINSIANMQTFLRHNSDGAFASFVERFRTLKAPNVGEWVALNEYVVFYKEDGPDPDDDEMKAVFTPLTPDAVSVSDVEYDKWIFRLDSTLGERAGVEDHSDGVIRPWFEVFVGGETVDEAARYVEDNFIKLTPKEDMPPGSLAIMYPIPRWDLLSSLAPPQTHKSGVYFGLLRSVSTDADKARWLHLRDREWHQKLLETGRGRGYLSSTTPQCRREWQQFYGSDRLESLCHLAQSHDPDAVFSSRLQQG